MQEYQVEYLDYTRPNRTNLNIERENTAIIQEVSQLLSKYRIERQPQKTQQVRPPYKISLNINLSTHNIVAKIGKCQQEAADAIVLPYQSSQLQYQPAHSLKEHLKTDQQKIKGLNEQKSRLYLRSKKLLKYKFRAFIKLQASSAVKELIEGLKSLIDLVIQNEIPITTMAIIYAASLFSLEELLEGLIKLELQKGKDFTFILVVPSRRQLNDLFDKLQ